MNLIFGDGRALRAYAASAEARPQLWRAVLCLIVVFAVIFGASLLIGFALMRIAPEANPLASLEALSTTGGVLFALATFLLWWPGLWLGMKLMHKRGLGSLFPATQRGPVRLFATGFAVAVGFGALSIAVGAFASPIERSDLGVGTWLALLPLALILLLIQTGAEELLFRGYLLQQLAARFHGHWIAWGLIPSLIFGALHYNPTAPGGAEVAVAVTALGGFVMAVVTARTGGLAAAWGLHMGVNTVALLIIGPPDYLSGLSLWHWTGDEAEFSRLAWSDFIWIAAIALGAAWWFRPPSSRQCRHNSK
ncbi:MAG: type II CAAX endopeptidase family protein [Pseudomonadota bacterium]